MSNTIRIPTSKTSLSSSSSGTKIPPSTPSTISDYQKKNLPHPPNLSALFTASKQIPIVQPLSIKVNTDNNTRSRTTNTVPGFLHLSPNQSSTSPPPPLAAILLSGAGGGVVGPSGIYLSMADKLASLDDTIPVLRLDYRYPARNAPCCADVTAGLDYLQTTLNIHRFCLIGWSFGGAPVFTVAANDSRVVGCATIASQTAETEGMKKLSPRPVLLLHGTGDRTLSPWCSQSLYDMYGGRKGERTLKMFEGGDHALTGYSQEAEGLLCGFVVKCAGVEVDEGEWEMLGRGLVRGVEKVGVMRRGGDLGGGEGVE